MSKRVLIFSIAYEPLIGGAELAVRNITDRLLDYEFDLITCRFNRKHKEFERISNVNVYRVGFGSRVGRYLYPVFAWRLASRLHKQKPYQIIWSIMAAYAGAAALGMLRRYPLLNFVVTLQEGDPIVHIHRKVRGFKKMWQRIFGRADYITAISKYLADWARAEGATCPIEIVPNGVDLRRFNRRISADIHPRKSEFTIITTSRLVHKNGVDILIKAMANVKAQMSNVKLIIAGSGADEKKLKELTRKLNLEENVEFLGDVESDKIPELLAQADIFARPSRSEGLGSAFLEAMAAGLPVIATPVGGIVDFLKDEETGLFSKPEDPQDLAQKIQRLIRDEPLREKLAENGRRLVEQKYNWDAIARSMDKIFEYLTRPAQSSPPSPISEREG